MNENAKKLVEALRSGEYEQTGGRLRDDSGYCCLGVACDLYTKETGEGEWVGNSFKIGSLMSKGTLLPKVQTWLNFRVHNGGIDGATALSAYNDEGWTFEQIADLIESEPEGLFV